MESYKQKINLLCLNNIQNIINIQSEKYNGYDDITLWHNDDKLTISSMYNIKLKHVNELNVNIIIDDKDIPFYLKIDFLKNQIIIFSIESFKDTNALIIFADLDILIDTNFIHKEYAIKALNEVGFVVANNIYTKNSYENNFIMVKSNDILMFTIFNEIHNALSTFLIKSIHDKTIDCISEQMVWNIYPCLSKYIIAKKYKYLCIDDNNEHVIIDNINIKYRFSSTPENFKCYIRFSIPYIPPTIDIIYPMSKFHNNYKHILNNETHEDFLQNIINYNKTFFIKSSIITDLLLLVNTNLGMTGISLQYDSPLNINLIDENNIAIGYIESTKENTSEFKTFYNLEINEELFGITKTIENHFTIDFEKLIFFGNINIYERYRNKKIGQLFICIFMNILQKSGFLYVYLYCHTASNTLSNYYSKLGFKEIGFKKIMVAKILDIIDFCNDSYIKL